MTGDKAKNLMPLMVAAVVGFGFLQGARLLDPSSGPYSHHSFAILGLVVDGFTFLAVALLSYFAKIERAEPLFVIGAVAAAVHIALDVASPGLPAAFVVMQIAAGIGWPLNVLCWMAVFVSYRPRLALLMIALGYAVDVAIQPLKTILSPWAIIVFAVVYAASIVLLYVCLRANSRVAALSKEAEAKEAGGRLTSWTTLAEAYSRTRRAIAATFAFSAVCGFVLESDYIDTGLEYAQTNLTSAICLGCAVVMVVVLLALKIRKADIDYVCPLAAVCISAAVVFRGFGIGGDYVAGCVMTATLVSFYVLLWLMFISEARERMLPAFFLLGLALAVARLSVAAGRLVAEAVHACFEISPVTVSMVALWMLATVASLVFFFSLRSRTKYVRGALATASGVEGCSTAERANGAAGSTAFDEQNASLVSMQEETLQCASATSSKGGAAKTPSFGKELPASQEVLAHNSEGLTSEFDAAFDAVARECGLSARESEVLHEFAMGRSAHYIAEWYMLSEHTVKTHIRRAYAKMDVHSRQELLDRIEEGEASLRGRLAQ